MLKERKRLTCCAISESILTDESRCLIHKNSSAEIGRYDFWRRFKPAMQARIRNQIDKQWEQSKTFCTQYWMAMGTEWNTMVANPINWAPAGKLGGRQNTMAKVAYM
jgi:hypothetical protein